jgi:hypothetical protein
MLSSIHPLGERARSNRWWVTVTAFAVGSMTAGALLGTGSALLGTSFPSAPSPLWIAAVVAAAGLADLAGIPVPWLHRQVNERWIGSFRGWVYGVSFGAQLGSGFSTYVVTWAVPALVVALALIGDPMVGLVAGLLFGAGRALPLLAAGWIDRPSRLGRFHQAMATLATPARVTGAVALLAGGTVIGLAAS